MKLRTVDAITPEMLRMMILALGGFVAFMTFNAVSKRVDDLRYTPLLGVNMDVSEDVSGQLRHDALPIVLAEAKLAAGDALLLSDELIAGAFSALQKEEDEIVEQEVKVDAVELLMTTRNPRVSAITGRGAVINGEHYSVGEKVVRLSIPLDGVMVTPVLARVGAKGAVLTLEKQTVEVPFVY